jgi:hypothetical protein
MGLRDAEHGEHRVAHELLEVASVALDLGREPVERATHHRLHDLGVLLLGERGRTDEVGEERGGVLALHARGSCGLLERRAAVKAELRVLRVLTAARCAGSHPRSLRPTSTAETAPSYTS